MFETRKRRVVYRAGMLVNIGRKAEALDCCEYRCDFGTHPCTSQRLFRFASLATSWRKFMYPNEPPFQLSPCKVAPFNVEVLCGCLPGCSLHLIDHFLLLVPLFAKNVMGVLTQPKRSGVPQCIPPIGAHSPIPLHQSRLSQLNVMGSSIVLCPLVRNILLYLDDE